MAWAFSDCEWYCQLTFTELSNAISDVGVASVMRRSAAHTIKSGSPSSAALKSDSAGTNITTQSSAPSMCCG